MNYLPYFDLESVSNLTHRAAIKALIESALPVIEIANRLHLTRINMYAISGRYLPKGFMKSRSQAIKDSKFASITPHEEKTTITESNDIVEVLSLPEQTVAADTTEHVTAPTIDYKEEKYEDNPLMLRLYNSLAPKCKTVFNLLEEHYLQTKRVMHNALLDEKYAAIYGGLPGRSTIYAAKHVWALRLKQDESLKDFSKPRQISSATYAAPPSLTVPNVIIDYQGIKIEVKCDLSTQADGICKLIKQLSCNVG